MNLRVCVFTMLPNTPLLHPGVIFKVGLSPKVGLEQNRKRSRRLHDELSVK